MNKSDPNKINNSNPQSFKEILDVERKNGNGTINLENENGSHCKIGR